MSKTPKKTPKSTQETQASTRETLYYHTFTPEIFIVTNAEGVLRDKVEVHNGSVWRYDSMLCMTTDDKGEPTPHEVMERAIESFMTNFVVRWAGSQGVVYK